VKAVVFQEIGEIRLDEAPAPTIEQPTDAILRFAPGADGAREHAGDEVRHHPRPRGH
jgi:hypothetical protein